MATLSEWEARIERLLDEMEADGVDFEFTACCCGGGLEIKRGDDKVRII